jgi:hypothetical protein
MIERGMRKCKQCNGKLKRVHRTFLERFSYMAIFGCPTCETEEFVPRRYTYHFGESARCPRCGSFRPTKLRERDKIDKMQWGIMNLAERWAGGRLYHCCFCRLQFYDRRPLAERHKVEAAGEPEPVAIPPDTAKSDA